VVALNRGVQVQLAPLDLVGDHQAGQRLGHRPGFEGCALVRADVGGPRLRLGSPVDHRDAEPAEAVQVADLAQQGWVAGARPGGP
jgi:hypothetical protein